MRRLVFDIEAGDLVVDHAATGIETHWHGARARIERTATPEGYGRVIIEAPNAALDDLQAQLGLPAYVVRPANAPTRNCSNCRSPYVYDDGCGDYCSVICSVNAGKR